MKLYYSGIQKGASPFRGRGQNTAFVVIFATSSTRGQCYPHDGRADKDSYPHDGRADKDSYPHDRRADKDSYPHDRHKQCVMLSL